MNFVIIVFGAVIVVAGLFIIVKPQSLLGTLKRQSGNTSLQAVAVGGRLLLGAALITYAPQSQFPATLHVLGWIAIIAAIGLLAIGRNRFQRMIEWAATFSDTYARMAGVVAVLFGAFLVYAVI